LHIGDPFAHPQQHINVLKHPVYVWRRCGNHSALVWGLNQCSMTSFVAQLWHENFAYHQLPKFWAQQVWWKWFIGWSSCPINCIWMFSNTLYMFELEVGTIPCGSGASTNAPWHHL
jgi:hypothetical protein